MAGKLVKTAAALLVIALVWKFVVGGDEAPEPEEVDRID
ncbi:uncharacterized protein HHUB_2607 [Halobacterium hubeiense]|jgi:hypothetical protein|uniref:Uncharacterized protein n=1 Tax=Halobacterium hubeiense TaxID=1407499 RepID=A0A0U5H2J3_9EURY|nr:uncharacterized protein HHUB_2607 [Halobacterium hubeiense]